MEVRLCLEHGGDGTRLGINALNDTGSDIMTLFYTDLMQMGPFQQYAGWTGDQYIGAAGGQVERLTTLMVDIRLVRPETSEPWGGWMKEQAVLRTLAPGLVRLTGGLIRDHLWFGTAPGNAEVAVSSTKGGMNAVLN